MAGPNAAAAVVAVPETWHVNPYHGKFNPSTKAGQAIFEKKTKGLPADERFTATKKDSHGIRRLLQAKSSSLSAVVTRVLQEYDGTGNVTAHGNLLTEYWSQVSMLLYFEQAAVQSSSKDMVLFKSVCESISSLIRSINALNLGFGPDKSTLRQYRRIDSQVL